MVAQMSCSIFFPLYTKHGLFPVGFASNMELDQLVLAVYSVLLMKHEQVWG